MEIHRGKRRGSFPEPPSVRRKVLNAIGKLQGTKGVSFTELKNFLQYTKKMNFPQHNAELRLALKNGLDEDILTRKRSLYKVKKPLKDAGKGRLKQRVEQCKISIISNSRLSTNSSKDNAPEPNVIMKRPRRTDPLWVKSLINVNTLSVPIVTRSLSHYYKTWLQCAAGREGKMVNNFHPYDLYHRPIITRSLRRRIDMSSLKRIPEVLETPSSGKFADVRESQSSVTTIPTPRHPTTDLRSRHSVPKIPDSRKMELQCKMMKYMYGQDVMEWNPSESYASSIETERSQHEDGDDSMEVEYDSGESISETFDRFNKTLQSPPDAEILKNNVTSCTKRLTVDACVQTDGVLGSENSEDQWETSAKRRKLNRSG